MALDAVDVIKEAFGSLTTDTGLKLVGAFFVIQLVNLAVNSLSTMGVGMALVGFLVSIVIAAIGIMLTIGSFRALDSSSVDTDQFTENIVRPFLRLIGVNITTTAFVFLAAVPALMALGLSGLGITGSGVASGIGILGLLFGALSVAIVLYVILALIEAMPEIAVGDARMFEALDTAVQNSKGEKVSMFVALLPVFILNLATVAISVGTVGMSTSASYAGLAVAALVGSITTVALYATLVEFYQRL